MPSLILVWYQAHLLHSELTTSSLSSASSLFLHMLTFLSWFMISEVLDVEVRLCFVVAESVRDACSTISNLTGCRVSEVEKFGYRGRRFVEAMRVKAIRGLVHFLPPLHPPQSLSHFMGAIGLESSSIIVTNESHIPFLSNSIHHPPPVPCGPRRLHNNIITTPRPSRHLLNQTSLDCA